MTFIQKAIIVVLVFLLAGSGLFYFQNYSSVKNVEQKLNSLHRPLGKPASGDWLSVVKESGQTFQQFVDSEPNKKTKNRNKVYIRPIGEFSIAEDSILILTADYLEKFYNMRVEILDSISTHFIPETSKRNHQEVYQASAKYILDSLLAPSVPKDGAAYIAFTKIDLYNNPKKNFVFGLGSLKNRVGVYSLARFGSLESSKEEGQKYLLRTLKVASHELGHIFSIKHCIEYRCLMNGSNSMTESDLKPVYLCPTDLRKIVWNNDINQLDRFKRLENFWAQNGFKKNAEFYRNSIIQLEQAELK